MPKGFSKSVIVHIILIICFGLPIAKAVKREIIPSHPIPIVFDKIEKEAVPQQKSKPAPKKEVKKQVKVKPQSKPKPPAPKKIEKPIQKEVVKVPTKPKPLKEMKRDFSSLLDDIDTEKPVKETPKRELEDVLKDLTPEEYKPAVIEEPEEEVVSDSIMDKLKDKFTIGEEDALRAQIRDNWVVNIGAKDVENMEVDIKIKVAKKGVVNSVDIIKNKYYQRNNRQYEVFVQSAKRAILKSSPLKLSDERMMIENEITFHFSPRDMF